MARFGGFDEGEPFERKTECQIFEELRQVSFDPSSTEWQRLSAALLEYGYTVLVAWGASGELGHRAIQHGGLSATRVPANLQLEGDEARGLASEVLIVAIEKFRTKSLPSWSPTGGANLRTFFIGCCLMELADVYERWTRIERSEAHVDPTFIDDGRHGPRPAEEAEARVALEALLNEDPVLHQTLVLQEQGYLLEEIAKLLGSTTASLSSRKHRFRQRWGSREEDDA